jgi:hypothetical protein
MYVSHRESRFVRTVFTGIFCCVYENWRTDLPRMPGFISIINTPYIQTYLERMYTRNRGHMFRIFARDGFHGH